MKTLYLHIGTPKTATSSIQKFMLQNQEILAQHGYCYPKRLYKYPDISSNRNAHFMLQKLYSENGERDLELEEKLLREGLDNVVECFKQYDNVVLSDEGIWYIFNTSHKHLFPYLEKEAREQGYQLKIIVYLRRQDQFLTSVWNQRIKQAKTSYTITLEDYVKLPGKEKKLPLNYASRLDQMAELFGKENLIVRRFDSESWVNHSIIHDFMDCIGLKMTDEYELPSLITNTGLSGNAAEIKRIINKDTSFTNEENTFLAECLKSISADSSKRYPCSMLSAEETQNILKKYSAGNSHVAAEYIGDGKPLFSDKVSDLPEWERENPYMLEDIIHFIASTSITLHRENEKLQEEIALLRQSAKGQSAKHPFLTLRNRIFPHKKSN